MDPDLVPPTKFSISWGPGVGVTVLFILKTLSLYHLFTLSLVLYHYPVRCASTPSPAKGISLLFALFISAPRQRRRMNFEL